MGGESLMAEVIRERVVDRPSEYHYHRGEDTSANGLLALILVIVVLFLLFWYGIPVIRSMSSVPTVNVPKQVDVNIHTNGK